VTFALAFCETARAEPSKLPPEIGYNHGELETPRSVAVAGGLRAMSNSTDSIFVNPANMAASRVYHVGGIAQIWPQADRQSYGVAAVDSSRKHGIAGGLAATWTRQDSDGVNRKAFDFRLAVAAPLSDQFYFGGGLRYLSLSEDGFPAGSGGLEPSIAAGGLDKKEIVNDLTFDAGLTLKPVPEVSIGLVGQNLTDNGNGFLPLVFGGGIGFGNEDFSLEADAASDFSTYDHTTTRLMGGGELLLGDSFPVRAGYGYDEGPDMHWLSAGFGFISREFSLDAGMRAAVRGPSAFAFVLGFKYHVDSGTSDY
jgi:hypothetical protein